MRVSLFTGGLNILCSCEGGFVFIVSHCDYVHHVLMSETLTQTRTAKHKHTHSHTHTNHLLTVLRTQMNHAEEEEIKLMANDIVEPTANKKTNFKR